MKNFSSHFNQTTKIPLQVKTPQMMFETNITFTYENNHNLIIPPTTRELYQGRERMGICSSPRKEKNGKPPTG